MSVVLYRVPWQPTYLLRLETLNLLGRACELAGHNIEVVDTFRTFEEQDELWEGFIHGLPGYNTASNPNDPNGQNNHRRATAIDIKNVARDRRFMLSAGFIPDAVEDWHFNLPGARNFAQINDFTIAGTTVTALNATPIVEREDMIKYFVSSLITDQPNVAMFGGPGVIPIPIPNATWNKVLTRYADAMNEQDDEKKGQKLRFSTAEWKLIRQALSADEPSADLVKAIDQAGM